MTEQIRGSEVREGHHVQNLHGQFFIATAVRSFGDVIRIEERTSTGYVISSMSVRPDSVMTVRSATPDEPRDTFAYCGQFHPGSDAEARVYHAEYHR